VGVSLVTMKPSATHSHPAAMPVSWRAAGDLETAVCVCRVCLHGNRVLRNEKRLVKITENDARNWRHQNSVAYSLLDMEKICVEHGSANSAINARGVVIGDNGLWAWW